MDIAKFEWTDEMVASCMRASGDGPFNAEDIADMRPCLKRAAEIMADALAAPAPQPELVGYLPAYELDRVRSGHDGRLRSAKFGPSELDGDIPVYAGIQSPSATYPHEAMDAMALARYKVSSDSGTVLGPWAVRAGDGDQVLYHGTKSDCEAVALRLTGAFLDGGFAAFEATKSPCSSVTDRKPLTRQQIDNIMTEHYPLDSLLRENVDAFEACVRDIERAHGITAPEGKQP